MHHFLKLRAKSTCTKMLLEFDILEQIEKKFVHEEKAYSSLKSWWRVRIFCLQLILQILRFLITTWCLGLGKMWLSTWHEVKNISGYDVWQFMFIEWINDDSCKWVDVTVMMLERSFLAAYSICTLITLQTLWRRVIFLTRMRYCCIFPALSLVLEICSKFF